MSTVPTRHLPGRAYTDNEGYVWVYDPDGGDPGKGLVWYSAETCDYWRIEQGAELTLVPLPDARGPVTLTARGRMAEGNCPECGRAPDLHAQHGNFWDPQFQVCDLRRSGVIERIEQSRRDADA